MLTCGCGRSPITTHNKFNLVQHAFVQTNSSSTVPLLARTQLFMNELSIDHNLYATIYHLEQSLTSITVVVVPTEYTSPGLTIDAMLVVSKYHIPIPDGVAFKCWNSPSLILADVMGWWE